MDRFASRIERVEWEAMKVKLEALDGTKEMSRMKKMEHKRDERKANRSPPCTAMVRREGTAIVPGNSAGISTTLLSASPIQASKWPEHIGYGYLINPLRRHATALQAVPDCGQRAAKKQLDKDYKADSPD